jgi:archaeal flagellar protein FlaJ
MGIKLPKMPKLFSSRKPGRVSPQAAERSVPASHRQRSENSQQASGPYSNATSTASPAFDGQGKPVISGGRKFSFSDIPLNIKVLIATVAIAIVLLGLALASHNFGIIANAIILCTFIVASPQFLFMYAQFRDLKAIEEKFPVFLRDVIEQLRSGMPLHKSVMAVGGYDYGKLSPHVKKMAVQLSWGMPLDKVMDQFAGAVRERKRLYTDIKLIQEAYKSGGDVVATLSTVTDNANLLEDSEKERATLLNQYVVLMYAICFIFVGIVISVNNLMVPIFKITTTTTLGGGMGGGVEALGISNPCSSCYGSMCFICSIYEGTAYNLFSIPPESIGAYYISMFFYMSVIQSLFSGLVAGQIGENSVKAGIKHSLILVSSTIAIFYLLIYLGILGT